MSAPDDAGRSRTHEELVQYVVALLAETGDVSADPEFGGHSISAAGVRIAIVRDGYVFLLSDDAGPPDFVVRGKTPVGPWAADVVTGFRRVPAAVLEDTEAFAARLRRVIDVIDGRVESAGDSGGEPGWEPAERPPAGISLMLDPALKRARDLRLLLAVHIFIAAAVMLAMCLLNTSLLVWGLATAAVGAAVLVNRRRWAQQTARAEACARDAVPAIATIVAESTGRGGLRRVTLRADGADASTDFTWLLPASWGDVVRLDRGGRRVAVLAQVTWREQCVPLLRSGRPFVVPDYIATALIALLLEDIPEDARHPGVADLAAVRSGEVPAPPALPAVLVPSRADVWNWWALATVGVLLQPAGAWLILRHHNTIVTLAALFLAGTGIAVLYSLRGTAVRLVVADDALEVRGPLAAFRGARRIAWDDVGSVALRWTSRALRRQMEEISLGELVASGALKLATGVSVRVLAGEEQGVGDIAARLLRGDIVPELDTVVVSVLSPEGKPLAVHETRTVFQPVRALLARCDELGVPVESSQAVPSRL